MKCFYNYLRKVLSLFMNPLNASYKGFLLIPAIFMCFSFGMTGQNILTVNSTDDTSDINLTDGVCADGKGKCTLRAAIETANQTTETDRIHFDLKGKAPFIISLTGDLPPITETVVLDATSLKGYSWAQPVIIVDGRSIATTGFRLEGQSSGSTIQGFVMGNFNIPDEENILRNGTAIYANATGSHLIKGNFLGVAADGSSAFPNVFGLALVNSSGNTIGGPEISDKNVISGNYITSGWGIGIYIHGQGSFDNNILGNYIGTDVGGTISTPNYYGIVTHEGANKTIIGGASPESRNIISGNIETGVYILSPDNIISGNYIGLGKDGNMLANSGESHQQGIRLWTGSASNNTIGGLAPGEANVISGNNLFNAITIGSLDTPLIGNRVLGNLIGTDPSGQVKIPNYRGITIGSSKSTTVLNNLISGNVTFGLSIHYSRETTVQNNLIGTTSDGNSPLGNGREGIKIVNGSENNHIGGINMGEGNTIAHNAAGGIVVSYYDNIGSPIKTQPLNNSLLGNTIFGNANIGIDLNSDGISSNDQNDADEGANRVQNFPEINEGASVVDQILSLQYSVPSDAAYTVYPITVEFFKSDGNRQGMKYLGADLFTEQDYLMEGSKNIILTLSSDSDLISGDYVLATATDAEGNTSEFSAEVQVTGDCDVQIWYTDTDMDGYGIDLPETNVSSCTQPEGNYVNRAGDCDDNNDEIHPEAEDFPDDGIDQNCDGEDTTVEIIDSDNDGVADSEDNCPDIANSNQADSNGNGIGDACESANCLGTDILNLSECTSGSLVFWTVTNPGECAVDVRWEVRKSSESGAFTLNAGESKEFTTSVVSKGQTQVIVYWNDSTGTETKTQANATGASCNMATTSSETTNEAPFVYPNPIEVSGFYISFSENYEGKLFNAAVYDLNSRLIEYSSFNVPPGGGSIYWNINTESWIPGVYVLKLESSTESFQLNLVKE